MGHVKWAVLAANFLRVEKLGRRGPGAGWRGRAGSVTRREREVERAILLEGTLGRRDAGRQRSPREGLEIRDAGVAPPARLASLDAEERGDRGVSLGVDIRRERGPSFL